MSDYLCQRCQRALDFDEVGYLGPADPKDTSCSPMTKLICLCLPCASKDPRYCPEPPIVHTSTTGTMLPALPGESAHDTFVRSLADHLLKRTKEN